MVEMKFDQSKFNEQRKLWQNSNVLKYKYQYKRFEGTGEDAYEEKITAENGKDSSVLTIDNIYDDVEIMVKENNKYINLVKISIEYDEENHIPTRIKCYFNNDHRTSLINRTLCYIISDFEILA